MSIAYLHLWAGPTTISNGKSSLVTSIANLEFKVSIRASTSMPSAGPLRIVGESFVPKLKHGD